MAPTLVRIDAFAFRAPTSEPVATSFGTMRDRPSVFLRLEASDGAFGWGEIFANWPVAGAEHRVNLLVDDISSLVLGWAKQEPSGLFHHLERATHLRALQCGEFGPFRQVIAGIDIAFHDLLARRKGVPVTALIMEQNTGVSSVRCYASGIHSRDGLETVNTSRQRGHNAFKIKIGFDTGQDLHALETISDGLNEGERLFTDANQAWSFDVALDFVSRAKGLNLDWLEEPLAADAPEHEWQELARRSDIALAAGENIATEAGFARTLDRIRLGFVQPDIMKWGGFTGCLAVAALARQAGVKFCPHYLGGGIGLAASANLLAAAGGDGLLEMDVNPNPLRDAFEPVRDRVSDGCFKLDGAPGLGIEILPDDISPFRTLHRTCRA